MPTLCLEGSKFPMQGKHIPKFERPNRLNINVFELNGTVSTPIYINKNNLQPQRDLFLYENHFLITKLHCLINDNSHMNHVCRRCSTALSSELVLFYHIKRCIKQQPTKIGFSWKDQLKFEGHHIKLLLPMRVHTGFEFLNNRKMIQIFPTCYLNKFQLQ